MKLTSYQKERRQELLYKSTSAEKATCQILQSLGVEYIRQYPIKTPRKQFYADIYIPKYRLVIEIDGRYHFTKAQKRLDANRSACIRRLGYHVYRLTNLQARKYSEILALLRDILRSGKL